MLQPVFWVDDNLIHCLHAGVVSVLEADSLPVYQAMAPALLALGEWR